jgi:hypothetical protein
MSLPVPNWESESQRRADSKDNPISAHPSDLPPLSNHSSSLGEATEATTRRLPPDQGSDRGPPDTEIQVSLYSPQSRSQSPTIRLDARDEAPTERTPGALRTYPLTRRGALQTLEPIVLITRKTSGHSPPTGRFDPKARLLPKGHMSLTNII